MQSETLVRYDVNNNGPNSLYNCSSGGIPTIDSSAPYCVVKGGAPRMSLCCAQSASSNNPTVNFFPDCYSWCNVNLPQPTDPNVDPTVMALQKFSNCLKEDQDPKYSPEVACQNRTGGTATDNAPTSPSPTTSGGQQRGLKELLGVVVVMAMLLGCL